MVHRIRHRKKYPSDLTDEQWATLGPLIPPAKQSNRGGRPRTVDMREVLNTLFYLNRSGCQWEMLPHDLLPKSTVYDSFAQWRDDETWAKGSSLGCRAFLSCISKGFGGFCSRLLRLRTGKLSSAFRLHGFANIF